MHGLSRRTAMALLVALTCSTSLVHATDVDGPNDCLRTPTDYGDAPDGVLAYPATLGCFPTCTSAGPVGTLNVACPPISTAPGPTGFVRHVHFPTDTQYWLGCIPTNQGIDGETNGKVNDNGAAISACATGVGIDCVETAFGINFGQDECYGSTDAGVGTSVSFIPCASSTVTFDVWNCGPVRQVFVNVLVDWNQDGDWNDNFQCIGGCAFEWAVKNQSMIITEGCTPLTPAAFLAGPNEGNGWMRITISDNPVTDDFPWAGSAPLANNLRNGETEDYPVTIGHEDPCPDYEDWGDAPEGTTAYPGGVIGCFPTCAFPSGPGVQNIVPACPPISTPPGPTGYVRHLTGPNDPFKFWLGCGNGVGANNGVDSEINGKMNATGGPISFCATPVGIDCVETAFTMLFGQDECYGDPPGDAGVLAPLVFSPCTPSSVPFNAFNCEPQEIEVYLNILVDWNEDGDWNDNFMCPGPTAVCAYEWALKNVLITLPPGCSPQISPFFLSGPNGGNGWLRITLSPAPVSDDFPWRGTASLAGQDYIRGGETEDYPVTIQEPCDSQYRDFGDAPEDFPAYASGVGGHFPTCIAPSLPGDQDIECGAPQSSPPATTGYVTHLAAATDPYHFWLGCAVDDEANGKTTPGGGPGSPSFCSVGVLDDCGEAIGGGPVFGQDECYGDAEAALSATVIAEMCTTMTLQYKAELCEQQTVQVYLNILADWNQDGDWNDNVACKEEDCALEWAVKNVLVPLSPGCNTYNSPLFLTGPFVGPVWMRISLSAQPAPVDFPWNGTVSIGAFNGGETEDYVMVMTPETTDVPQSGASSIWFGPVIPNPARDQAVVDYTLPRAADVSISVYDLAGRRVTEIERGSKTAGTHQVGWNFRDASGRSVPLGYYILKLRVGDTVLTRRVIRVN